MNITHPHNTRARTFSHRNAHTTKKINCSDKACTMHVLSITFNIHRWQCAKTKVSYSAHIKGMCKVEENKTQQQLNKQKKGLKSNWI